MPQEKKYIEAYTVIMASGKNFFEGLIKMIATIGGGFLFVEIMKAVSKKTTYGVCPNCDYNRIPLKSRRCPVCKTKLNWTKVLKPNER